MVVKHGKYKWNPDLSRDKSYDDHISVFDCAYTAFDLNLPDVNNFSIDFKHVDYEMDDFTDEYVRPTYYLEIWWDDIDGVYVTRNFQNLKGTFNKYVRHIEQLLDNNNLNKETLDAFLEQVEKESDVREKYDKELLQKKDLARRFKNFFGIG